MDIHTLFNMLQDLSAYHHDDAMSISVNTRLTNALDSYMKETQQSLNMLLNKNEKKILKQINKEGENVKDS